MNLLEKALKKREILNLQELSKTKQAELLMASKVETFAPIIEALTSLKDVTCKPHRHGSFGKPEPFSESYSIGYQHTSFNFWDSMGGTIPGFFVNNDLQISQIHSDKKFSTDEVIEIITDRLAERIITD